MLAAANPPRSSSGQPTQAAAVVKVKLTGILTQVQGKYLLRDEKTNHTFELRGKKLAKYDGSKIAVQGQVASGASAGIQVVTVSAVTALGAAAAAAGAGATAAAVSAGVAHGTIIAVGAGVASAAGAVGGLYATNVIGSTDQPASRP